MEQVSALLGHSSLKVTERHCAPWVLARQEQLEAAAAGAWRHDPVAQMETLRSATVAQDGQNQRRTATYARHGDAVASNYLKPQYL